ncbi:MAG: hypothetical protein V4524_02810 [Patescibacteria group bacterium]
MKTKDEKYIVNLANQLIGNLKVPIQLVSGEMNPREFNLLFRKWGFGSRLETIIRKMNPETLGHIVMHAINDYEDSSDFRRTMFQDIFQEGEVFFKRSDIGLHVLQEVAYGVVVATMYDILITEWWIGNVEEGSVDPDTLGYKTRPAMRIFVRSVRLHDLLQ